MPLLDGYSGYNQILVHEDNQDNPTFTTPWCTFKYSKMSFGLKNVGATFQRAMDIAFGNENTYSLFFYSKDLNIYSNSDDENLHHFRVVF